ncbi:MULTISPECIES: GNAT family N-acetyltransferase [Virgibacillus]|nr:GNAT family N-acetyltransferase [Virgibacillus massiliensis]
MEKLLFELRCVMEIRKANSNDALGVAKVQVNSWKTTYNNIVPDEYLEQMTYENREKKWKDIIPKQDVFVAENNKGEIVGFSNAGEERTGKYPDYKGELYAIYILKEHQGKGIGKLLLNPVVESLKDKNIFSMAVSVLEENKSRLFYEHLGAKEIDSVRIEVLGKGLNELVYGWDDIKTIF